MNRWKAAGIHLSISAMIAVAVVAAMLLVWYPGPFFTAMGGNELVTIIVGVDVVLGPLITLIIFDVRKAVRLIRLDLTIIGLIQLSALAYGVHVMAEARPVYMSFTVDRFDLVAANEIRDEELAKVTREEFKRVPWGRPVTVAAKTPSHPDEQFRIIQSALRGADLQTFPQHYVPYGDLAQAAIRKSLPIGRLRKGHPEEAARIERTLKDLGRSEADTRYLPLKGRARDYSVLIDAKSGAVVGFLTIVPW